MYVEVVVVAQTVRLLVWRAGVWYWAKLENFNRDETGCGAHPVVTNWSFPGVKEAGVSG
jgi:hypothetical protein